MEITEPVHVTCARKMAAVVTKTSESPTGVRLLLEAQFLGFTPFSRRLKHVNLAPLSIVSCVSVVN